MSTLERLDRYKELLDTDAEAARAFVAENSDDLRFAELVRMRDSLLESFRNYLSDRSCRDTA